MTATEILRRLQSLSSAASVAGMARFGIRSHKVYGVSLPELKGIAPSGRDHILAEKLWSSGVHEARLVACFVENPAEVTPRQMERWARDFDNWAVRRLLSASVCQSSLRIPEGRNMVRPGPGVSQTSQVFDDSCLCRTRQRSKRLSISELASIGRERFD